MAAIAAASNFVARAGTPIDRVSREEYFGSADDGRLTVSAHGDRTVQLWMVERPGAR